MKKTKILTVLGVLLALGVTACGGKGGDKSKTSQKPTDTSTSRHTHSYGEWTTVDPTCTQAGSRERSCECGEKQTETIPALGHDFGEQAQKIDVFEEEGAVKEEMFKCTRCDVNSIRWSALDYDVAKTTARSTKGPEKRDSNKAVRFDSTANYQDQDTTKKGCHIVYNVYIPEDSQNLTIAMKTGKRTDNTLPPVVNMVEDDNAKGYEYVNNELVRPATRYGLKIDGEIFIVPEDQSGQDWKEGINWYSLPGQHNLTAGIHEIEFYNLGGYRADFYEFALVGFGPHEHVAKYDLVDAKANSAGKVVTLGQDKITGEKAIEIAFRDYTTEPANPSGTNPWYLAKDSFVTWTINVDKAIEGAKLYFSLECSSDTHLARHLFNEAKWNEEHPDNPVALPGQSPDKSDEAPWRYAVAVGETNFPMLNNGTMAESGVKATNTQTYVYFTDINLAAGENVLKLTQCNIGYRMKFNQNVRIVYSGDAVLAGEHAHVFNQFVSETTASCTQGGEKVMKCFGCEQTDTVTTPKLEHVWGEAQAAVGDAIPHECENCHVKCYELAIATPAKLKENITWNISGLPEGNYEVHLYACASSTTLTQKYDSRYQFQVDSGTAVGASDDNATYASYGLGTGEALANCKWSSAINTITVGENAASFKLNWTNKGYSAFIAAVRLVKAAAQA